MAKLSAADGAILWELTPLDQPLSDFTIGADGAIAGYFTNGRDLMTTLYPNGFPAQLAIVSIGNNLLKLSFSGPLSRWSLEMQSSLPGLSSNWATVPNALDTNLLVVPVDTTSKSTFYRLSHP